MKTPFLSVSPTNGFVDHWIPSKIRPTCPVFWASEHCKTGHKTGFVFAKLKNFSNIIHFAKFFFIKGTIFSIYMKFKATQRVVRANTLRCFGLCNTAF